MLAYILLGLILIVLAILSIPISFSGQGRVTETLTGWGEINWAWGLMAVSWDLQPQVKPAVSLHVAKRVKPWPRSQSSSPPKAPAQKKASRSWQRSSLQPWLERQVLREILLLVRRLRESLGLRWDLSGEYGADDPALTGIIAGFIAVLAWDCGHLNLCPRFDGAGLDLQGDIEGRIIPVLLLWISFSFAFSKPIRKIWWSKLGDKIKKNRRRMAYV